jgi:hypothetical protein
MKINEFRKASYVSGKMFGDINAFQKGRISKRIQQRVIKRIVGKIIRKWLG